MSTRGGVYPGPGGEMLHGDGHMTKSTHRLMESLFNACVVRTTDRDWHSIRCARGLWSVAGQSPAQVEIEARHYWMQYYRDGDYTEHLEGRRV
jgi:aspartate/tyrosine/aromatic aminotransferase